MAARRTRRRALRDVAFELRIQQVVPVFRLRHAQALQDLGLIHDSVGFEYRADPEPLWILERDRLRLADARGDRVRNGVRQTEFCQQILLGELVEQRALATPEN